MHIITHYMCMWACAPTWTSLYISGAQTWYMLKVWWRSDFIWPCYGYMKKVINKQMDKQMDNVPNLYKDVNEIWSWSLQYQAN